MRQAIWRLAFWLALAVGLSACDKSQLGAARHERKGLAVQNFKEGKAIQLAVVWHKENSEFLSGAMLAAEEINAEGGVAGRRIALSFTDETPFVHNEDIKRRSSQGRYRNAYSEAGTAIAETVIARPEITAVIGHMNSEAALSAMLAYQENGVLFLSGAATDSRILWSSQHLYFQLRPQDEVLVKTMADTMRAHKWDSTYLVYAATRHNEQVVELLKSQLAKTHIKLAGSFSVMPEAANSDGARRRMQGAIADIRTGNVDSIVLLAPPELGARVVRHSRSLGVLQPFLGTGSLDSPKFINLLGEVDGDLLITSLYRSNSFQVKRFAERFKKRFPGQEANEDAAMAYDSVRLYAEAVATAGTTDPVLVAQALHYRLPIWYGLMGTYSFKDAQSTTLKYRIRKLSKGKDKSLKFVSTDDPA